MLLTNGKAFLQIVKPFGSCLLCLSLIRIFLRIFKFSIQEIKASKEYEWQSFYVYTSYGKTKSYVRKTKRLTVGDFRCIHRKYLKCFQKFFLGNGNSYSMPAAAINPNDVIP